MTLRPPRLIESVIFALVAAMVGYALWTANIFGSRKTVHGTVTSAGGTLGAWTVGDDAWESCASGEPEMFLGVRVFTKADDQERLVYVQDAAAGGVVKVWIPGTRRLLVSQPGDCTTLEGSAHRTDTRVNRIWNVEGSVRFDCVLGGGRVYGEVRFTDCH